jgi:hemolysin III
MNPGDFGPIYAETVMGRFPVEPWNTFSNLVFLFVCIHFARKTALSRERHPLLVMSLPVLLVGYIGGTVFHATRSANIWLYLDFMPIFILTLAAAVHFWSLLLGGLWRSLIVMPLPFAFTSILHKTLPLSRQGSISIGYLGLACGILLPGFLFCLKDRLRHGGWLFGAFASFGVAITFRLLDKDLAFPMGTHFLWHIFGGLSTFSLMNYIYLVDVTRTSEAPVASPTSA